MVPGFIKYVIDASPDKIIKDMQKSLSKLEKNLDIEAGDRSLPRRFLTIGRVLLEKYENLYKIEVNDTTDFDYRVGRVRHALLDDVAQKLKVKGYDTGGDAIHKLRKLFSTVEMLQVGYHDKNLPAVDKKTIKWAHEKCIQAFDFIVIKRGYIIEKPSPERLYEWLDRFESLVSGKPPRALGGAPHHLPRRAYVIFAEPFLLSEYLADEKKQKKEMVTRLTGRIRKDIEGLLEKSDTLTRPLFQREDFGEL